MADNTFTTEHGHEINVTPTFDGVDVEHCLDIDGERIMLTASDMMLLVLHLLASQTAGYNIAIQELGQ